MVYKRYYSPFEEQKTHSPPPPPREECPPKEEPECPPPCPPRNNSPFSFLDKIGYDDLIIIGILIILLAEDKENRDIPLILALAFLFIVQYIEAE